MSITNQTAKSGPFIGASYPQVVPTQFPFQNAADLLVINVGQTSAPHDPPLVLTLGSDYTVTGGNYTTFGQMLTGNVTLMAGGANSNQVGDTFWFLRNVPINQTTSAGAGVQLTGPQIEIALDKAATISQELQEQANRSLRFEDFETLDGTLSLTLRKNSLLGFDGNGVPTFTTGLPAQIATIASLSALPVAFVSNNTVVEVLGYYVAGDGGGGLFYYASTSTAAVDGGSVIASSSGVGRWIRLFTGPVYAQWFGCSGTGTADNINTLGNLFNFVQSAACPTRTVIFPVGTYLTSGAFTFTTPIKLIGESESFPGFSPATVGTTIRYIGSTISTPFITFLSCHFGSHGIENIEVDGNSLTATTVLIDSCWGGFWKNFYPHSGTTDSLSLTCSTTQTNSWHTFINLNIDDNFTTGRSCVRFGGVAGLGNACHIQLIGTRIQHGVARNAILLAGCDNIKFDMTYINRATGGTGAGVLCDPTEQTGFPGECVFVHLEAGPGGWVQPGTTVGMPAVIYEYQTGNGQPVPVTNGTPLYWQDNVGSIHFNANSMNFIGSSGSAQVVAINGNSSFGTGIQLFNSNPNTTWQQLVDSQGGLTWLKGGTEAAWWGRSGSTTAHFDWLLESDLGFSATVAGATLKVKSGTNASAGTFTLVAGAVTVSSTAITVNSVISYSRKTASGTATALVITVAAGSFTVAGASTDAGTYNWINLLVN